MSIATVARPTALALALAGIVAGVDASPKGGIAARGPFEDVAVSRPAAPAVARAGVGPKGGMVMRGAFTVHAATVPPRTIAVAAGPKGGDTAKRPL